MSLVVARLVLVVRRAQNAGDHQFRDVLGSSTALVTAFAARAAATASAGTGAAVAGIAAPGSAAAHRAAAPVAAATASAGTGAAVAGIAAPVSRYARASSRCHRARPPRRSPARAPRGVATAAAGVVFAGSLTAPATRTGVAARITRAMARVTPRARPAARVGSRAMAGRPGQSRAVGELQGSTGALARSPVCLAREGRRVAAVVVAIAILHRDARPHGERPDDQGGARFQRDRPSAAGAEPRSRTADSQPRPPRSAGARRRGERAARASGSASRLRREARFWPGRSRP